MLKNLVRMTLVAVSFGGSILAFATSASAVYYNVDTVHVPSFVSGSPSYAGVSHEVARPESIVVAEYPTWCYWHPYHCDESD
jgi:hypothetical protein